METVNISIQNIIADYGNKPVIRNFTFSIPQGKLIFLLGNNGAGKSTFLKLLNGSLKPSQGDILMGNSSVYSLKPKAKAGLIASLPQMVSLEFDMEVFDVVISGAHHRTRGIGNYEASEIELANKILGNFGLSALKNRLMGTLSGGERQMVFLATIEMQNTPLLLLDEPTQHLDLYYKKQLFNQLERWRAAGKTLLVSTHDVAYLSNLKNAALLYFEKGGTPVYAEITEETLELYKQKMEAKVV